MQEIILNNEFKLSVPDGFHVLSEEEKAGMRLLEEGPFVGLSNPDRHIMATIGWKKAPGFSSLLLSSKDLIKNTEKTVRKSMSPFGYRCRGFEKKQIAGNEADSFLYEYTAQQVDMLAETCVMKVDKIIYYFNFYGRAALEQESLSAWNEILGSMQKNR